MGKNATNDPNEAKILAICLKWPENGPNFVIWPKVLFSDGHALQLITGNNAKFGKFSQKVGEGQRIWDKILNF